MQKRTRGLKKKKKKHRKINKKMVENEKKIMEKLTLPDGI